MADLTSTVDQTTVADTASTTTYKLLDGSHGYFDASSGNKYTTAVKGDKLNLTDLQARSLKNRLKKVSAGAGVGAGVETDVDMDDDEPQHVPLKDVTSMSAKDAAKYIESLGNEPTLYEEDVRAQLENEKAGQNRVSVVKALNDLLGDEA